jgi:membrane fusion protein
VENRNVKPPDEIVKQDQRQENQPLFRQQAVTAQQSQWLGEVLFTPKISYRLFVTFALLSIACVLALLFFADYARKERINGWLVPEQGMVRVLAPQQGVVTQLHVRDGEAVTRGAPLVTLSTEVESAVYGGTQKEIARGQNNRKDSLIAERELLLKLLGEETAGLESKISALRIQEGNLEGEIEIQQLKVDLAERTLVRLSSVRDEGLIADTVFEEAESNKLDQVMTLRTLEREKNVARQNRVALEAERKTLPLRTDALLADLDRQISALEQEMAVTESNRQIVIRAALDGTVTALRAKLGSSVEANVPVLSIVPAGSELRAELFVPSSAIGFMRPGQSVLLRYRAFAYQRFGHYQGTINNVSRSTINPNDLGPRLAGLTSLVSGQEAVYLVTVTLKSQNVNAYGEAIPLQAGMLLEADVIIETRRLVDWVFDPLHTLTGKLGS